VAWKGVDGELVALDEHAAVDLAANAAGATRTELVRALVGRIRIEEARASADTDAFLAELGELSRGRCSSTSCVCATTPSR
jgi:hypothetical protein